MINIDQLWNVGLPYFWMYIYIYIHYIYIYNIYIYIYMYRIPICHDTFWKWRCFIPCGWLWSWNGMADMGVPQNWWNWTWKILLRWMIWGTLFWETSMCWSHEPLQFDTITTVHALKEQLEISWDLTPVCLTSWNHIPLIHKTTFFWPWRIPGLEDKIRFLDKTNGYSLFSYSQVLMAIPRRGISCCLMIEVPSSLAVNLPDAGFPGNSARRN